MALVASGPKTPIWLDCDTGHDDAFAILLAAHHPQASLLGVSTVHGNASLDHTYQNSQAVLQAIGRPDVPVLKGARKPVQRPPCHAANIHGESGLGGVTLLPKILPADEDEAIDAIHHMADAILSQPPNTVHIAATGPLTNIYDLVVAHPRVVDHIAGLSIMGGAFGGGFTDAPLGTVEGEGERFGNWTPWAEFNIYADPEAAAYVFGNQGLARKTTLAALDLTHLVRGNAEVQHLLFDQHVDPSGNLSYIRRLFRETLMFFSGTYKTQFGIMDGPPLHDPLSIYAVLQPDAFVDNGGERFNVEVVLEEGRYDVHASPQNHSGQTIAQSAPHGIRIPRNVDHGKFWKAIDQALADAEAATAED